MLDIIIPAVDPVVAQVTGDEALATAGIDVKLIIVHDERREGFTRTVNRGLSQSTADAVLILNDDVRFPTGGWLADLWRVMQEYPRAGFVGPSGTCRTEPICSGKPEWVGGRYRPPVEVSHHPYFCTLLRREMLDEVGPLDERFIHYGSDVDHQWRAHRAGWLSYWDPMVYVEHDVAGGGRYDAATRLRLADWKRHDERTLAEVWHR